MSIFALELSRYGDEATCSTAKESGFQTVLSSTTLRSAQVPTEPIRQVPVAPSPRGKAVGA
jgi:hypothetical protein